MPAFTQWLNTSSGFGFSTNRTMRPSAVSSAMPLDVGIRPLVERDGRDGAGGAVGREQAAEIAGREVVAEQHDERAVEERAQRSQSAGRAEQLGSCE